MRVFICILIPMLSCFVSGQNMTLESPLSNSLAETSGLINLNGTLITHNDSGGLAELYEIDTTTGTISRTVEVSNATNIDWEDLSHDGTYIYIGDFGNNNGDRTDLRVYRILVSDYLSTPDDTVMADVIDFSYADQTDFTANLNNTNYDAEALISYQNDLYIFTKNWVDNQSNIYQLSNQPGSYSISKVDMINSQGLITGGTYNSLTGSIVLVGYDPPQPFTVELSGFSGGLFSNGSLSRFDINPPASYSIQIEAIAINENSNYYVTAEDSPFGTQGMFNLDLGDLLTLSSIETTKLRIFPNPSTSIVHISYANFGSVQIFDMNGALVLKSQNSTIDISELSQGIYVIAVEDAIIASNTKRKLLIIN